MAELAPLLAEGGEALAGTEAGQTVIGLGNKVISGLEKGAEGIGSVFNKGIDAANAFLDTPTGKVAAGISGIAFVKKELGGKDIDVNVKSPETTSLPQTNPLSEQMMSMKNNIQSYYPTKLTKAQQLVSSQQLSKVQQQQYISNNNITPAPVQASVPVQVQPQVAQPTPPSVLLGGYN